MFEQLRRFVSVLVIFAISFEPALTVPASHLKLLSSVPRNTFDQEALTSQVLSSIVTLLSPHPRSICLRWFGDPWTEPLMHGVGGSPTATFEYTDYRAARRTPSEQIRSWVGHIYSKPHTAGGSGSAVWERWLEEADKASPSLANDRKRTSGSSIQPVSPEFLKYLSSLLTAAQDRFKVAKSFDEKAGLKRLILQIKLEKTRSEVRLAQRLYGSATRKAFLAWAARLQPVIEKALTLEDLTDPEVQLAILAHRRSVIARWLYVIERYAGVGEARENVLGGRLRVTIRTLPFETLYDTDKWTALVKKIEQGSANAPAENLRELKALADQHGDALAAKNRLEVPESAIVPRMRRLLVNHPRLLHPLEADWLKLSTLLVQNAPRANQRNEKGWGPLHDAFIARVESTLAAIAPPTDVKKKSDPSSKTPAEERLSVPLSELENDELVIKELAQLTEEQGTDALRAALESKVFTLFHIREYSGIPEVISQCLANLRNSAIPPGGTKWHMHIFWNQLNAWWEMSEEARQSAMAAVRVGKKREAQLETLAVYWRENVETLGKRLHWWAVLRLVKSGDEDLPAAWKEIRDVYSQANQIYMRKPLSQEIEERLLSEAKALSASLPEKERLEPWTLTLPEERPPTDVKEVDFFRAAISSTHHEISDSPTKEKQSPRSLRRARERSRRQAFEESKRTAEIQANAFGLRALLRPIKDAKNDEELTPLLLKIEERAQALEQAKNDVPPAEKIRQDSERRRKEKEAAYEAWSAIVKRLSDLYAQGYQAGAHIGMGLSEAIERTPAGADVVVYGTMGLEGILAQLVQAKALSRSKIYLVDVADPKVLGSAIPQEILKEAGDRLCFVQANLTQTGAELPLKIHDIVVTARKEFPEPQAHLEKIAEKLADLFSSYHFNEAVNPNLPWGKAGLVVASRSNPALSGELLFNTIEQMVASELQSPLPEPGDSAYREAIAKLIERNALTQTSSLRSLLASDGVLHLSRVLALSPEGIQKVLSAWSKRKNPKAANLETYEELERLVRKDADMGGLLSLPRGILKEDKPLMGIAVDPGEKQERLVQSIVLAPATEKKRVTRKPIRKTSAALSKFSVGLDAGLWAIIALLVFFGYLNFLRTPEPRPSHNSQMSSSYGRARAQIFVVGEYSFYSARPYPPRLFFLAPRLGEQLRILRERLANKSDRLSKLPTAETMKELLSPTSPIGLAEGYPSHSEVSYDYDVDSGSRKFLRITKRGLYLNIDLFGPLAFRVQALTAEAKNYRKIGKRREAEKRQNRAEELADILVGRVLLESVRVENSKKDPMHVMQVQALLDRLELEAKNFKDDSALTSLRKLAAQMAEIRSPGIRAMWDYWLGLGYTPERIAQLLKAENIPMSETFLGWKPYVVRGKDGSLDEHLLRIGTLNSTIRLLGVEADGSSLVAPKDFYQQALLKTISAEVAEHRGKLFKDGLHPLSVNYHDLMPFLMDPAYLYRPPAAPAAFHRPSQEPLRQAA